MRTSAIEMGDPGFENHSDVAFVQGNHEIDRIARPAKSFTKQQLLPRMKFFADDNGRHYTS